MYAFIYVLQYIDHITQISESNVNIPTLPVYKTFNVFIFFFYYFFYCRNVLLMLNMLFYKVDCPSSGKLDYVNGLFEMYEYKINKNADCTLHQEILLP